MRQAAELLTWCVLLLLLNIVFISEMTPLELWVGLGAAVAGAIAARAVRKASAASLGSRGRLWPALWAWPSTLLMDTWHLAAAVFSSRRRRRAGFRVVELPPGVGAAWACALTSATPGSYVVRIGAPADGARDSGRGSCEVVIHTLDRGSSALDRALIGSRRP